MPITTTINGIIISLEDYERQECEIWSRVMGYYRPVSEWNIGKRAEFKQRIFYDQKQVFGDEIIEVNSEINSI